MEVEHSMEERHSNKIKSKQNAEILAVENIKILIVDDNLINRKVACGFLKSYNFDLSEAESGRQAIEMVKKTRFQLIFMDYMMPDMDGIEATRIIRSQCGENGTAPVIVALTANASEGSETDFLHNGFQDFLTKPLDKKPLDDMLEKWMSDGSLSASGAEGGSGDGALKTVSEPDYEDIRIPGIDIEEAKKYNSGGVKNYLELLELYSLDGRRKMPFLSELIHKKDYRGYEIEAHALKSASAKLGAVELSALARDHEAAADRGDYDFLHMHFSELLSCYDALLKEIGLFLQAIGNAGGGQGDTGAEIDSKDLLARVRSALESVEDFRSRECAQKVDALLEFRLDGDTRGALEAVREQLKMYEDDEAERLLRELSERIGNAEAACQDVAARCC